MASSLLKFFVSSDHHSTIENEHTLFICATCNTGEELPVDIEDLGLSGENMASSVALLYLVQTELVKKGWKSESVTLNDKSQDGKVKQGVPSFRLTKQSKVLNLKPICCLSTCGHPHVIALRNTQKFAFQFGALGFEDIGDIVTVVENYCDSQDGYSNVRSRPGALSRNILARIPPYCAIENCGNP